MSIIYYNKNGLEDIPNKSKKVIIKVSDNLFSTHIIVNKNLSNSQAKKSIPFNLEAELLDDIENLDFFIKKIKNIFNVVVIKKQTLIDLKNIIKEKELEVIGAYLSFMFLPKIEDKVSYFKEGSDIIFREGDYQGGILNKDLFFTKFSNKEGIEKIESANYISKDYYKINLLQYDIKNICFKFIRPYFSVAIIFLLIFIIQIVITIVENSENEVKLKKLKITNEQLFKTMFPNVNEIVDIKIQTEQKLITISSQHNLLINDFLSTLLIKKINSTKIKSLIFDKTLEVK